jgi:hypothetical protein
MREFGFENPAKLKRIGEYAFAGSPLTSITIPASAEKIDGSAFVGCPSLVIRVEKDSRNFVVEGNLLTTADGKEIVRYFGRGRKVIVPVKVELLGKSCFESCDHAERVIFENGSKLRTIGPSALSRCEFLGSVALPDSVVRIEESAFKKCDGLEECLIGEKSIVEGIGKEAFADCLSLRSFSIPKTVEEIGENCFHGCGCLHRLRFGSRESLKSIIAEETLDQALVKFGLNNLSSLFRIEVNHEGGDVEFPGWSSSSDNASPLVLVRSN